MRIGLAVNPSENKSARTVHSLCCIKAASAIAAGILISLLLVAVPPSTALANTYYVDSARPDDSGDGTSWITAKRTIAAGIGASGINDTILVKYGTYLVSSACSLSTDRMMTSDDGTNNTWASAAYDETLCVIDASDLCRVFEIIGATVTSDTHVRGFKITGGNATNEGDPNNAYGGGLYIAQGADPVIEHCWITTNTAGTTWNGYGGGIACLDSGTEPTIQHCTIDNNVGTTVWFGFGGGIYCNSISACDIYDNDITENLASVARVGSGGGICCENATADIRSNTISYNKGSGPTAGGGGNGGGIYVSSGDVEIWDNVITYNIGTEGPAEAGFGGGIYLSGSGTVVRDNPQISYNIACTAGRGSGGGINAGTFNSVITRNVISNNTASTSEHTNDYYRYGQGGGIICAGSNNNQVIENIITDNVACMNGLGIGGGIYFASWQVIQRNVIAFNTASVNSDGSGGGTWSYNAGSSGVTNNTFYGNANTKDELGTGSGSGMYHDTGGVPAIINNIFEGHDVLYSDSVAVYCNPAATISYNCFHDNPGGDYNASITSLNEIIADPRLTAPGSGDFTLRYDSPCIEEGDPGYAVPENGAWVVDIGAIEYTGTRHWRPVAGTGELLFGGMVKAKVNVTTLGTLSEIDMVVHPAEKHSVAPVSVERWYEIDHVGSGTTFDLTLSYLETELMGRAEDSLVVWRWTGNYWDGPKEPSTADLAENWLTVTGQTEFSDWIMTDGWGPTGASDLFGRYYLYANYPNPFNPATTIEYQIPVPCRVEIIIYDVAGQLVRMLEDADRPAGLHKVIWDGRTASGSAAASGVYFYRLISGAFVQTRKMVVLK